MDSLRVLRGTICVLRAWQPHDAAALPALANDPVVARYLTHKFPQPYRLLDAQSWVRENQKNEPLLQFAIHVDARLAGGIGVMLGSSEHTGSASVGYWLGRAFWGRGVATDALEAVADYAFVALSVRRLWANVMAPNVASTRVLIKAGFAHEATLRRSLIDRLGDVHDELIFARFPAALT